MVTDINSSHHSEKILELSYNAKHRNVLINARNSVELSHVIFLIKVLKKLFYNQKMSRDQNGKIFVEFHIRNDKYRGILIESFTHMNNEYFLKHTDQCIDRHSDKMQKIFKQAAVKTTKKLLVDITEFYYEYFWANVPSFKGCKLNSTMNQLTSLAQLHINKQIGIGKRQATMANNKQKKIDEKNRIIAERMKLADDYYKKQLEQRKLEVFGPPHPQTVHPQTVHPQTWQPQNGQPQAQLPLAAIVGSLRPTPLQLEQEADSAEWVEILANLPPEGGYDDDFDMQEGANGNNRVFSKISIKNFFYKLRFYSFLIAIPG